MNKASFTTAWDNTYSENLAHIWNMFFQLTTKNNNNLNFAMPLFILSHSPALRLNEKMTAIRHLTSSAWRIKGTKPTLYIFFARDVEFFHNTEKNMIFEGIFNHFSSCSSTIIIVRRSMSWVKFEMKLCAIIALYTLDLLSYIYAHAFLFLYMFTSHLMNVNHIHYISFYVSIEWCAICDDCYIS